MDSISQEIKKDFKIIKDKFSLIKSAFQKEIKKDAKIGKQLGLNAQRALHDLETGRVFTDDDAAENLKNTLLDTLKVAEMAAIFSIPGGAIGLAALIKLLKSKEAKALKIENLLTLSIEEDAQKDKTK